MIYEIIDLITYPAIIRPAEEGTKEMDAAVLLPIFTGSSVENKTGM